MKELTNRKVLVLSVVPKIFQHVLNVCLILLAMILSFLLVRELVECVHILLDGSRDYKKFLANILLFFLYFEFITMIVKYFKEDYHFPMRYFLYIGITAMIRQIIVEHEEPLDTLLNSLVILILIIGYFIMNYTPLERPSKPVIGQQGKREAS